MSVEPHWPASPGCCAVRKQLLNQGRPREEGSMRIKGLMGVASLVSAAVLALTSCSGGGSATESGSTSLSGEVIKLEYLHRLSDGQGMTPVAEIIKKWNDTHPNVQVIATRFSGKPRRWQPNSRLTSKPGPLPAWPRSHMASPRDVRERTSLRMCPPRPPNTRTTTPAAPTRRCP